MTLTHRYRTVVSSAIAVSSPLGLKNGLFAEPVNLISAPAVMYAALLLLKAPVCTGTGGVNERFSKYPVV